MKIIALQGSPRLSGNTAILVSQFTSGARTAGMDVEVINITELDIQPCDACDLCECGENETCAHNDSMKPLMNKIMDADALLVATPVWWTGMSSKLKLFFDRLYGYRTKRYLGGKGLFLITTYFDTHIQDLPLPGVEIAAFTLQSLADYTGMEFIGHLRAAAVPGKVLENPQTLNKAFSEGKNFAKVIMSAG